MIFCYNLVDFNAKTSDEVRIHSILQREDGDTGTKCTAPLEMMKLLTIKEGYGVFPPVVLAPFLTISIPPKINLIA